MATADGDVTVETTGTDTTQDTEHTGVDEAAVEITPDVEAS